MVLAVNRRNEGPEATLGWQGIAVESAVHAGARRTGWDAKAQAALRAPDTVPAGAG